MSYSTILLFHELSCPELDGMHADRWCTFAENDRMLYLLNGGRIELVNINEVDVDKLFEELHFTTEADCHFQAHTYYSNYKQEYPYMKEWKKSLTVAGYENNKFVVESEIMRFE